MRVSPSLASHLHDVVALQAQLDVLISFAKEHIIEDHWNQTHISLKATAGLRTLETIDQEWLISHSRDILRNSGFLSDPNETKVISGRVEALFAFVALNTAFPPVKTTSVLPSDMSMDVSSNLSRHCEHCEGLIGNTEEDDDVDDADKDNNDNVIAMSENSENSSTYTIGVIGSTIEVVAYRSAMDLGGSSKQLSFPMEEDIGGTIGGIGEDEGGSDSCSPHFSFQFPHLTNPTHIYTRYDA